MRLEELAALPSFALLSPGFADGGPSGQGAAGRRGWLLLRELRPAARGETTLVFAPFEDPGSRALALGARSVCECDVDLIPDAPEIDVDLIASGHARKVEEIRQAIARGDVYQVCLTFRARVTGQAASGAHLLSLMCARAVPRFAAWVRLPDGRELVSASPELFFETGRGQVHSEPMKGTARPGAGGRLEASDKDRCELAMITDLVRNDLAPVCRPRSIRVANERRVLELPYALQTVSDVVGVLDAGATPLDVLAVLHPGGSVTGAPKQAALAMIRALEETPRGAYCGALGLWTGDRSVFSLLIRTAARADGGWVYGVGGGIVFDSDPRAELEELHVKLGALRGPARRVTA
jgi:anthranilate/para-aminobenzoate synthase component I